MSTAKTGLGEITCSHFIPSCLLSARILQYIIQDSNKNQLSDVVEKSLLFWKPTFGCQKKQTVRCFTKYTPKNQIELNRIEAICIVVVVLLIFTLSFLIILFFMLFHLIFLPLTFSGMHVCTMHTGSYPHASSGNVLFLSSII